MSEIAVYTDQEGVDMLFGEDSYEMGVDYAVEITASAVDAKLGEAIAKAVAETEGLKSIRIDANTWAVGENIDWLKDLKLT